MEGRKRGRPRTRPLPDPNQPKRPNGRPQKVLGVTRVNLGFWIMAEQEEWLHEMKSSTGLSYGEIIDRLVERYKDVENS